MQRVMAVFAHAIEEDALFAVDQGRRVLEGSLQGDVCFFDDLGHVFEELGPGFLPFFGFPVVAFVVVGVAVGLVREWSCVLWLWGVCLCCLLHCVRAS